MTEKNIILAESLNYKGNSFDENYFFSKLAKGFVADYNLFGEDTASFYTDVFGEEYSIIFEEMFNNINILTEAVNSNSVLLFETPWDDWVRNNNIKSPGSSSISDFQLKSNVQPQAIAQTVQNIAPQPVIKPKIKPSYINPRKEDLAGYLNRKYDNTTDVIKKGTKIAGGFLSKIWNGIKKIGVGLTKQFPKLTTFFEKGLGWIIENPMKVVGIAGGAVLLGKLISTLKKNGDMKRAAKLQTILDAKNAEAPKTEENVEKTSKI
jgi:hypothetical protein